MTDYDNPLSSISFKALLNNNMAIRSFVSDFVMNKEDTKDNAQIISEVIKASSFFSEIENANSHWSAIKRKNHFNAKGMVLLNIIGDMLKHNKVEALRALLYGFSLDLSAIPKFILIGGTQCNYKGTSLVYKAAIGGCSWFFEYLFVYYPDMDFKMILGVSQDLFDRQHVSVEDKRNAAKTYSNFIGRCGHGLKKEIVATKFSLLELLSHDPESMEKALASGVFNLESKEVKDSIVNLLASQLEKLDRVLAERNIYIRLSKIKEDKSHNIASSKKRVHKHVSSYMPWYRTLLLDLSIIRDLTDHNMISKAFGQFQKEHDNINVHRNSKLFKLVKRLFGGILIVPGNQKNPCGRLKKIIENSGKNTAIKAIQSGDYPYTIADFIQYAKRKDHFELLCEVFQKHPMVVVAENGDALSDAGKANLISTAC